MATTEDFVGTGWSFPIRVDATGGIAMVRREREVEQAMALILRTYPGERPMRPEFGSRVRDFVFRSTNEQTRAELGIEVRNSLARWEPRVEVEDVLVETAGSDRDALTVDIAYTIKGTNDRRNLVVPFYTIPDDGSDY